MSAFPRIILLGRGEGSKFLDFAGSGAEDGPVDANERRDFARKQ
jgi:hypothetical protein